MLYWTKEKQTEKSLNEYYTNISWAISPMDGN